MSNTSISHATASLPSVDLYGPVHKGLRLALTNMLTRLGTASGGEREQLWELVDDLDGVLFLFDRHVAHEEEHIHPALDALSPGASWRVEADHAEHAEHAARLQRLGAALIDASPERAPAILRTLHLDFSSFVADNLMHMHLEETVVQPLLESLMSPEDLQRLEIEIVSSIGPEVMMAFMRVMVPANDPVTRAMMLAGAQQGVASEVFLDVLQAFRPTLSELDWMDLIARLGLAAAA